ncbi:hypothetical protein NQ315_012682 [Exocentrus adspersus]|uniref:Gustatory receptor n=1 Tax=Exocentrus adspersus TaxID=1586481 RepID=A0AAV8VSR6_9CUCU|nr:hypothetical protein NQ315_012682 [Exocentrus adspersus]
MFWKNLDLLDQNLKKLNYQNKHSLAFHTGVISTCFTVLFLVHAYEVLNWYSSGSYVIIYSYMNFRLCMYYQLLVVLMMCYITRMLKLRIDFLKRYLRKVMARKRGVLWNVPQENESNEFQEISKLYGTIYNSVKLFNYIFGWHIYFVIMASVLEVLSSVSFGLTLFFYLKLERYVLINVLYTCIVLSCDRVEKSGRSFSEACILLQRSIPESSTRKGLRFLAQFSRGLVPEITSAGFYKISQSVLMSILSTVATYVIISLQFNKV